MDLVFLYMRPICPLFIRVMDLSGVWICPWIGFVCPHKNVVCPSPPSRFCPWLGSLRGMDWQSKDLGSKISVYPSVTFPSLSLIFLPVKLFQIFVGSSFIYYTKLLFRNRYQFCQLCVETCVEMKLNAIFPLKVSRKLNRKFTCLILNSYVQLLW
jgi:hypothetical protein